MRPDLPWNVAGISSEAREAARAAARREGLSVGEWLTRRIVSGLTESNLANQGYAVMHQPRPDWNSDYRAEPDRQRRDSDAMLDRVSKSEAETAEVYRRIEDQLRNMARRLDASERNQTESSRVMSKAAVEMNIAAREQAQAFDQLGAHVTRLAERLDRVENREGGDTLRDAVKALHLGLSRLADQITETATQSATQISNLANNLETVAGRVGQVRQEAETANQALEARLANFDERVQTLETTSKTTSGSLTKALEAIEAQKNTAVQAEAVTRLEAGIKRLEEREMHPAADKRLATLERTLADMADRLDQREDALAPLQDNVRKVMTRLELLENTQRDAAAELRRVTSEAAKSQELPPPPQPAEPAPVPPPAAAAYATQTVAVPPPFTPPPAALAPSTAAPAAPGGAAAAFGPLPGFEPPPFADAAPPPPPFVAPAAQPAGFADPLPNYELPPETFVAQTADSPTVESYLAAARRSARAAAQQEAERTSSLGGLHWGASPKAKEAQPQRTRPLLVGLIALIAIAVIGGAILSRQASRPAQPALMPKPPVAASHTKALPTPAPELHAAAEDHPPAQPAATVPAGKPAAPAGIAAAGKPNQQVAALPPQASQQAHPAAPLDRLTQAANSGNAKAQLLIGLKYLDGDGIAVNETEAAKWLSKAADAGEPVAQLRLAGLYDRGRGVPADAAKAAHLYQASANQGNRKAMYNLAVAYTGGAGVPKNYTEASRWFLKSANLGLIDAQFNLAVLYERGLGVPQNLVDAYKWYAIAAAQGDGESKSRLNAITSQLDGEARAAAQHAADVFKPGQLDARANVAPTAGDVTRG